MQCPSQTFLFNECEDQMFEANKKKYLPIEKSRIYVAGMRQRKNKESSLDEKRAAVEYEAKLHVVRNVAKRMAAMNYSVSFIAKVTDVSEAKISAFLSDDES